MPMETDLGTLIRRLNPYTDGQATMHFTPRGVGEAADPETDKIDLTGIELEVESNNKPGENYQTQWAFKGQSHNVVRAIRIKYHYPVKGSGGKIWATDHLLVGFEGTGGP